MEIILNKYKKKIGTSQSALTKNYSISKLIAIASSWYFKMIKKIISNLSWNYI